MANGLSLVLFVCATACSIGPARASCPPHGETTGSLQALKAAGWRVSAPDPDAARHALALELVDCLGSPDPVLRDELAFEALSAWMRGQLLGTSALQALRVRLTALLEAPDDAAGFRKPFAALALAEVARVDRLRPFLSEPERASLVDTAASYLTAVRDYRGHDAQQGWRHGVAHGSDLALQLSLNPALSRRQGDALLAAIASQVLPFGDHAYRYGEGDRLMTPVFYLSRRDWWQPDDWQHWLNQLVERRGPSQPTTPVGLARRHNLGQFLTALYVAVQEHGNDDQKARLLPGLRKALAAQR
jgi:hypothetical protein